VDEQLVVGAITLDEGFAALAPANPGLARW
jgi:hypothetical protein